jgi:hypothetical protein
MSPEGANEGGIVGGQRADSFCKAAARPARTGECKGEVAPLLLLFYYVTIPIYPL